MADAQITVVGNLTRDPELRFAASGMQIATLGLAVNYRRQNKQTGEWDEETSFMNVVCFGQLAENAAESLTKGARVLATGRLQVRNYDRKDGGQGTAVEIVADEIGPSLRWATAEVQRTAGGGGGQGGGQPGRGSSQRSDSDDFGSSYDATEEPF